jgi:SAM-dependent methyltransferase
MRPSSWLAEPLMRNVDVDSPGLLEVQREILASKPLLSGVFQDFYDSCIVLDRRYFSGSGIRVEIGAGISQFKRRYPDVIVTDIKPGAHLDMVVDALAMPFGDETVRALYAINAFHHFPDPDRFFDELERVLAPGGGCVLIDPHGGALARWLYPRLFATETYDLQQPLWQSSESSHGVMSGANQALSQIVFVRDLALLRERHPRLEFIGRRPLTNYPRYLLSGGLNFRQLVPSATAGLLRSVERLLAPMAGVLALHEIFVLRKRAGRR